MPIVNDTIEELYYNGCGFNLSDQSWWWIIGHDPTISTKLENVLHEGGQYI